MTHYTGPERRKNRHPHSVPVTIKPGQMPELADWLKDCCQGDFNSRPPDMWLRTMKHSYPGYYSGSLEVLVVVSFEKASDASLFKLSWAKV